VHQVICRLIDPHHEKWRPILHSNARVASLLQHLESLLSFPSPISTDLGQNSIDSPRRLTRKLYGEFALRENDSGQWSGYAIASRPGYPKAPLLRVHLRLWLSLLPLRLPRVSHIPHQHDEIVTVVPTQTCNSSCEIRLRRQSTARLGLGLGPL
jgi:hypothetical protein